MSADPRLRAPAPEHVPPSTEVRALAVGVVLAALGVLVALQYSAFAICGQDVSGCPDTTEKNGHWAGRIRSEGGQVLRREQVSVDLDPAGEQIVDTDADGRVCVLWPGGGNVPYVRAVRDGVRVAPTVRLEWTANDERPPPPGCARTAGTVRWNQADDLTSDPRFVAPGALSGVAVLLLLPALGGLGRGDRGRRLGDWAVGLAVALAGVAWIGVLAVGGGI